MGQEQTVHFILTLLCCYLCLSEPLIFIVFRVLLGGLDFQVLMGSLGLPELS